MVAVKRVKIFSCVRNLNCCFTGCGWEGCSQPLAQFDMFKIIQIEFTHQYTPKEPQQQNRRVGCEWAVGGRGGAEGAIWGILGGYVTTALDCAWIFWKSHIEYSTKRESHANVCIYYAYKSSVCGTWAQHVSNYPRQMITEGTRVSWKELSTHRLQTTCHFAEASRTQWWRCFWNASFVSLFLSRLYATAACGCTWMQICSYPLGLLCFPLWPSVSVSQVLTFCCNQYERKMKQHPLDEHEPKIYL